MQSVIVSLALIIAGAGLTLVVARVLRMSKPLTWLVVASYALRVTGAVGLYLVSAWHLPILRDLQMPNGFWLISRDAEQYHRIAVRVAESLRAGTALPDFSWYGDADFFIIIAYLYRLIGAHPVYVPLINATIWSGILGLAYFLGRRLRGERAGALSVALVAAWPSAYIWSAQVLKDSLALLLMLVVLAIAAIVLEEGVKGVRGAMLCAVMIPVALVLARLRIYVIPIVLVAIGAVLLLRLGVPSIRGRVATAAACATIGVVLIVAFLAARAVNVASMVTPLDPQGDPFVALPLTPTTPPSDMPGAPGVPETTMQRLLRQLSYVTPTLSRIAFLQERFRTTNEGTAVAEDRRTSVRRVGDVADIVLQVPTVFAYAMWSPFPWQWFVARGDTGAFRQLSAIEVVLVLLLTPWLCIGVVRGLGARRDGAWLLIAFSITAAVLMGLTVTSIGILFRLRLQFLLPLLIITAAYGLSDTKLAARISARLSPSPSR